MIHKKILDIIESIKKKEIGIENIVTLDYQIRQAYNYYRNNHKAMNEMLLLLFNFIINNEKIMTKIDVTFTRKNVEYKKDIFIILTKEMANNLYDKNNYQFFSDVIYYAITPGKKKYKLFIILSFNQILFKFVLW